MKQNSVIVQLHVLNHILFHLIFHFFHPVFGYTGSNQILKKKSQGYKYLKIHTLIGSVKSLKTYGRPLIYKTGSSRKLVQ